MRKQNKQNLKILILLIITIWYVITQGWVHLPQTRTEWGQLILVEVIGFLLIGLFILWARSSNNRWWANMEATVIPQHLALIEKKQALEESGNASTESSRHL